MIETNIAQWGNSRAVRIPESIMKSSGFALGERVVITTTANRIIISRSEDGQKKLSAAGILHKYSDPSLRAKEKTAFADGVTGKYGKTC